jgi:type IV pilus assembly protein PilQ
MRVDSRKVLSVGLILLISTLAVNGATSREATIVKDVSFNNEGDFLEAKITATGESKYKYFELKSPHRLVVDFLGIQNTIRFKEKKIDAAGVERVRTSLFSDKDRTATRIVFDLAKNVPYTVIDDGGGVVRVVFGDTERASRKQSPEPAKTVEPARMPLGPISPATKLASMLVMPEPAVQAEPAPQAPAENAPELSATTAALPAPPASSLMTTTESGLRQQTQVTIVPPTAPQVPSTSPTPTPQYTGEIISLDLKDYDVKDFFRLISEISGLNVVLDPNVGGSVTLKLTDVPWDQALDVVLKNYQLGGQLQGNVLRIATNGTLQSEQTTQKALRDAQDLAVPLITRTFQLNYTKADAVSNILKGLLSPRGTIIQDARRNALIVSDIPSQFGNLENMVKFVDTPSKQVEIEARLLQANKSFSRDIGNQIGLLVGANHGNVLTGLPSLPSPLVRNPAPRVSSGSSLPLIANFPAAATSGLSFFIQPGGDILLDEIISAAESKGTAKLISRPRVTTQNNIPATIQQGTQIPVQTNVNNTITTAFQSFALQLTVTPQITEAGTILLQVNITNSQPDFARAVNGIPSVANQSATTQVLIPDGGTAVIGGILVDTDSVNIRQVPGLGSLPVIGILFKNTNTIKSTAELVFFITPRIKPIDSISVLAPGEASLTQPQQR